MPPAACHTNKLICIITMLTMLLFMQSRHSALHLCKLSRVLPPNQQQPVLVATLGMCCSRQLTSSPDMVKCFVSPRVLRICSVLIPCMQSHTPAHSSRHHTVTTCSVLELDTAPQSSTVSPICTSCEHIGMQRAVAAAGNLHSCTVAAAEPYIYIANIEPCTAALLQPLRFGHAQLHSGSC